MPQTTLIQIRDITRRDAKTSRILLDRVNLIIGEGEQIGLTGPSGSGKSSLLRAIAMLDRCDTGQLLYRGESVSGDDVPAYRRKVIYMPQHATLVAGSVRENLKLPFQLSTAEDRFEEAAMNRWINGLAKPQEMMDQSAEALSGGERQMVALIRAVSLAPQVLLLDEPTASLDPESTERFEQQVMAWLHDSPAAGRALVWTSHDADQVRRMTNRTVEMRTGVLTSGGEDD